jgi:hypothetical protein
LERNCAAFGAFEIAGEAGAHGDEASDAAIEAVLFAVVEGAIELGLGGHGGGEGVGAGGEALGLHGGQEGGGLGVAEASDAPTDVDEFVDHLEFGGGGRAPVGEFGGGEGVEGVAGLMGEEGALKGDGAAGVAGGLGAAGDAGGGFGAAGFGAVGAADGGALFLVEFGHGGFLRVKMRRPSVVGGPCGVGWKSEPDFNLRGGGRGIGGRVWGNG